MTAPSPQKPPFKERALQYALCYAWIALLLLYISAFFFFGAKLSLGSLMHPLWIFGLSILGGLLAWKSTFQKSCQKSPYLYPLYFLLNGFSSRKIWNKPPLFFYTEDFHQEFKDTWLPYIAQKGFTSTISSSPSLFDSLPTSSISHDDMSWRANPMNPSHPHHSFHTSSISSF